MKQQTSPQPASPRLNEPLDQPVGAPQDLNLMTHRAAGASVWDRRGWDGTSELAMTRWLLGIGGGALAVEGLRRTRLHRIVLRRDRRQPRLVVADRRRRSFGSRDDGLPTPRTAPWRPDDLVHDASADSFPASDAPSWTPTVGTGLRHRATASPLMLHALKLPISGKELAVRTAREVLADNCLGLAAQLAYLLLSRALPGAAVPRRDRQLHPG